MMAVRSVADWLEGTPYLPGETPSDLARFEQVGGKSEIVLERVKTARAKLATLAQEMIIHVHDAVREEQVAQSNRIEGYDWTAAEVRQIVDRSEEILNAPVRDFLEAVKSDPRAFEALGLFQAHRIAEDWAAGNHRPTEVEIRQLHQLITAGDDGSGQYRTRLGTEIEKQAHEPPHPLLVPQQMREFAEWWGTGCPYPVLTATVAHAWLTHIHPFDDGNGRIARLLANLALVQAGYPPLIVRSNERGRYYDALAASDEGDILPLFGLFAKMQERVAARLENDGYLKALVEQTFLATSQDRYVQWRDAFGRFRDEFRLALDQSGWSFVPEGFPEVEEFDLLANSDPAGNSWWAKLSSGGPPPDWLAWFGYCSWELTEVLGRETGYPSIFLSPRDSSRDAVYPYRPRLADPDDEPDIPHEIVVIPGLPHQAFVRVGVEVEELPVKNAARMVAEALITRGKLE